MSVASDAAPTLPDGQEAGTRTQQLPGLMSGHQILSGVLHQDGPRLATAPGTYPSPSDVIGDVVSHLSPALERDNLTPKVVGTGPGLDSPPLFKHHIFILMRSPTVDQDGYVDGLRPFFVCNSQMDVPYDRRKKLDVAQVNGLFTLEMASMAEARSHIRDGMGGLAKNWSLSLQLQQAAETVEPTVATDGSIIWVVTTPRNVTIPTTSYPGLAGYLAQELPAALNPVRAAVIAGAALPPAAWEDDSFQGQIGLSSPPKLGKWLAGETEKARAQVAAQLQDLHVLWDDSGYSTPAVYALPNKRAVASMVRWVGDAVQRDTLDEPSIRLFCSLLRRHDRYLPTFGDIPPELLTLEYGPSQRMPQSECLSAVYYPRHTSSRSAPVHDRIIRMDVGVDSSFSASLRTPADDTPRANLKRRLHTAIREDTRAHRAQSLKTAPAQCSRCQVGLANLQSAQGLPVTSTVLGEFHHVVTVAELCQRHCDTVAAPEALLQPPPNHHLFRPSTTRDDIRRALTDPESTSWLCPECHAAETAAHNREVSNATAPGAPSQLPPLNAWWTILQLGGQHGYLPPLTEPAAPTGPIAATTSDGSTSERGPSLATLGARLLAKLPPLPTTLTTTAVVMAVSIAASFLSPNARPPPQSLAEAPSPQTPGESFHQPPADSLPPALPSLPPSPPSSPTVGPSDPVADLPTLQALGATAAPEIALGAPAAPEIAAVAPAAADVGDPASPQAAPAPASPPAADAPPDDVVVDTPSSESVASAVFVSGTPHTSHAAYEHYVSTPRPVDVEISNLFEARQAITALQAYADACLQRIHEDREFHRRQITQQAVASAEHLRRVEQRASVAEAAIAAAEAREATAQQIAQRAHEEARALRVSAATVQGRLDEAELLREQSTRRVRELLAAHAELEDNLHSAHVRLDKVRRERDRLTVDARESDTALVHSEVEALRAELQESYEHMETARAEAASLENYAASLAAEIAVLKAALVDADADTELARDAAAAAAESARRTRRSTSRSPTPSRRRAASPDAAIADRLARLEAALVRGPSVFPTADEGDGIPPRDVAAHDRPLSAVPSPRKEPVAAPDVHPHRMLDDDDASSIARQSPDVEEKIAFYGLPTAEKMELLAASTSKEIVRQVLSASEDATNTKWRRRVLMTFKVVKTWAAASARRAETGQVNRNETEAMKKLETFKFATDLRSADVDTQAEAWDGNRSLFLNALRDCLISGADFEQGLLKLLAAARDPKSGNKRIEGYVRETIEDPLCNLFPPLCADALVFKLDLSYRTAKFGHDSVESDWDNCTKRHPDDDCVSLAVRCVQAYLQKLNSDTFTMENVWVDPMHRNAINSRYTDCLAADVANPTRGEMNSTFFKERWKYYEAMLEIDEAKPGELSCVRIARLEIRTKESAAPKPPQSAKPPPRARIAAPAAVVTQPDDEAEVNAVEPPPPAPSGKGKGSGGKGKGAPGSLPAPGRGSGAAQGTGVAPGTKPPPQLPTAGHHNSEPPPKQFTQPTGRRMCDPPAGGAGKPPGMQPGDWTTAQWRTVLVDFKYLDELSSTTAGKATAKARPNDSNLNTTRVGMPRAGPDGAWSNDACAYCAFRATAPADVVPADAWWYGTGKGDHNPYRCQPFKRYLAEGGDAASEPEFVPHLQRCLRVPSD